MFFSKSATTHHALWIEGLRQKLLDPDDRVRVAAIQTLDKFELEGLGALSKSLLFDVAQRCRDKKLAPRLAAIHSLGRIYKITYGAREDVQEDSSDKYKWIPGALFEALYTEDSATV